ncbi:hypothetical protein LCGC14_0818490 [marine sediment metagenome]|uniref:Uncharacterized protein n=1 Tax=marine sediment metagenome TaxID=412755 RepID=A0A0F9PP57_9ZZZZ
MGIVDNLKKLYSDPSKDFENYWIEVMCHPIDRKKIINNLIF